MQIKDIIEFRKDRFFEGAVQVDWFYNPPKSAMVAQNFMFHGNKYFGTDNEDFSRKKQTDTVSLVEYFGEKLNDSSQNPLSLAIADYGTGKSHLAVTLAQLFSGEAYMPETYNRIISNIGKIDADAARKIKQLYDGRNFVLVINGMRDFNLHSEMLRAAKKSLNIYGLPDDCLQKLNRSLDTATRFLERNSDNYVIFEKSAKELSCALTGNELVDYLKKNILVDDLAFQIVNKAYAQINGQEIQWDEGISVTAILEMLVNEFCGLNGKFDHVVILFDEFGRYLEYASDAPSAQSGDSGLQQIFEAAQNYEGAIQVINFIQSDIKTYLQRVDQTKNISRYIGRFDASDKYYISSNLETVFANLISRKDETAFNEYVVSWLNSHEEYWKSSFEKMNGWLSTKGVWKNYSSFRKLIVEGVYPLHPMSTFMLTQLSDYLQNRSSLTIVNEAINRIGNEKVTLKPLFIMPDELMKGDLYSEMLAAEQEGRQQTLYCIRYDAVLKKVGDKLDSDSLKVLRANLVLRILKFKTQSYDDAIDALAFCSGLSVAEIKASLKWLEEEYAVLNFDEHAHCFDFSEDSNGAHDFKIEKKRAISRTRIDNTIFDDNRIKDFAGVLSPINTNFQIINKISTNEWNYIQELYTVEAFNDDYASEYVNYWKNATSSAQPKGRVIWLYANKSTDHQYIERASEITSKFKNMPIIVMLLDDADDHLRQNLVEFMALDQMSDETRAKYHRYFEADYSHIQDSIRESFSDLQKKRYRITEDGITQIETRMGVYLTNIYKSIYPDAVPFSFDGLLTKNNTLGGKGVTNYCSIVRMLLSGTTSDDTIHYFNVEVRNRIDSCLMSSAVSSWKCISEQYVVIPPANSKARAVYDAISTELQNQMRLPCSRIFATFTMPPYGMCDEAVLMMLSVVCANLNYSIRFQCNEQIFNANIWKEKAIINDKKIDYQYIKQSEIIWVDANAVIGKYNHLFAEIEGNKDIKYVPELKQRLEVLVNEDELPEELKDRYNLSVKLLNDGETAQRKWDKFITEVNALQQKAEDALDIYNSLEALEKINAAPINDIFGQYSYTDEYSDVLDNLRNDVVGYIDDNAVTYIKNFHCADITYIDKFATHCRKLEKKFDDNGFRKYARILRDQCDNELTDIQKIKKRKELRDNCNNYLNQSKIDRLTPYTLVCRLIDEGNGYLNLVKSYPNALGQDTSKMISRLETRISELVKRKERVEKDIAYIWESVDRIDNKVDLESLLDDILTTLQSGLKSQDNKSLNDLLENLRSFNNDLSELMNRTGSIQRFKSRLEVLKEKYSDEELDFNAMPILESVNDEVMQKFTEMENDWKEQYLTLDDNDREAVHRWLDDTSYLPDYLSEETKEQYSILKKKADVAVSQGKIEDVKFYFKKLSNSEKQQCLDELKKMIEDK